MKLIFQVTFLAGMALILLPCSPSTPLFAQASIGAVAQITGAVSDPTGAVVPGAQVRVVQTETGFTRTAVTGLDGAYVLPNLAIGPYELQVISSGFKTYFQRGIVLQVNDNATVAIQLQVGASTESVSVSANASMVNTESTSVSSVIENRRVVDLPLNGRDLSQLVLLSGAAVQTNYGDSISSKNYPTSHTINVAGGEAAGTGYMVDGGGAYNDLYGGSNLPLPFPDAVQEFSVQTSMIPAQYGGYPGGAVNLVTMSGTNNFHGSLFEFIRNYAVNAANYFATTVDTLKRNQFGGTLGGPIVKNKLFFFGGYQGTRTRTTPPTSTFFVPTAAALSGDFSTLASTACTSKPITLTNPAGGTFAGNYIDPALFNASALQLAKKYLPATNDPCGKLLIGIPNPSNENQFIGRVDWTSGTRNIVFGRYFNTHYTNPPFFDGSNLLQTTRTGIDMLVQAVTMGDTFTFTSKVINSLHLTWTREPLTRGPAANLPSAASLGLNIAPSPGNTPSFSINGGFTTSCGTCANAYVNRNQAEVRDDVIWTHGRHQFTFGGLYERAQLNQNYATLSTGSYSFDGSFTGLGLADFLLGRNIGFSQGSPQVWNARDNMLGLYAQDNFHPNQRLTLMGGVRWSPYFAPYDIYGRSSYFDKEDYTLGLHSTKFLNAPPGVFFPGDTIPGHGAFPRAGTNNRLWNFAPRVGIAWDPTGSGQWSVRTAYGLFYADPEMAFFETYSYIAPYGNQISLTSPAGGLSNPYAGIPGGDPFPLPFPPTSNISFVAAGQFFTLPLHIHPPNTQQWNLSVQRQIGSDLLLTVSYLGNKSTHRWVGIPLDPAVYIPGTCGSKPCSTTANTQSRRVLSLINPTAGALIGSVPYTNDGANANYNAILLSANRRFSGYFSVLANYAWSHCISEGEQNAEGGGGSIQDPSNIRASRGNCISDVRHIFNLSYIAKSPHFKSPLMDKVLSNWQQSGIIGARSGSWLTPTDGQDVSLTNVGNDRPNLVGNPHLSNPTIRQWFNTSAYAKQATGTYGNAGSYSILGPGGFTFDAALSRTFKIRESQGLQVRVEAFNVLNHPVFNNPTTTLTSSNFGKILSANNPRILQAAIKYTF
ncbi:MAG: TonB-dependent receptor [Acidobacteria bacterium]|nr:TonB-dependent receptor [Acidobacteriota bacterium]